LYKITTNLFLDFIKTKHHQQQKHPTSGNFEVATENTPQKEMEQDEFAKFIHQAAQTLTPKQQAVFILRDLQGLSTEEIEETLGMSSGHIKSNLYYARQAMQEKMKKIFFTPSTLINHEL
jgi:RNA polymerase sigma-70 factor (ECF subfamily)